MTNELGQCYSIDEILSTKPNPYDVFLCGCGADERAYIAAQRLQNGRLLKEAVLFDFKERVARNTNEQSRRHNRFREFISNPTLINGSTHDKRCSMREFVKIMRGMPHGRVAVDISVMTKPYLFAVLYALKEKLALSEVDVYYTEPDTYIRTKKDGYSFTRGRLTENMEVIGYPGEGIVTRNDKLLILLLGFSGDASSFIKRDVDPKLTIPINGFPSYLLHYKDVSLFENRSLLSDETVRNEMHFAPAFDPYETYNVLDAICTQYQSYAISVAPLGPKPMALGLAMYALEHKAIRVVEALPEEYSNETSVNHGMTWVFRISF